MTEQTLHIHFRNIKSIKANQKWDERCDAIVEDFLQYFESMKDIKVRSLKMSKDRNFDAGMIDFCIQSIEKAKPFKEE